MLKQNCAYLVAKRIKKWNIFFRKEGIKTGKDEEQYIPIDEAT